MNYKICYSAELNKYYLGATDSKAGNFNDVGFRDNGVYVNRDLALKVLRIVKHSVGLDTIEPSCFDNLNHKLKKRMYKMAKRRSGSDV